MKDNGTFNEYTPSTAVDERTQRLLRTILDSCQNDREVGSFTTAIYDTAWVSMLERDIDGVKKWMFPECFSYVISTQKADGSWPLYASHVDRILNSLASLLALVKHSKVHAAGCQNPSDLIERIQKAKESLDDAFERWQPENTEHVGFEILVPALLRQLERHDIVFEFQGKEVLFRLHRQKLSKFRPDIMYGDKSNTFIHSLEGLIDLVDFDRLQQHKRNGSMFGSPAATAAYLLNVSQWDPEAENFLREVELRRGKVNGLPSAYPNTIFEITWALSTLLSNGLDIQDMIGRRTEDILLYLRRILDKQGGLVGYASAYLPDADDTAKSLLVLSQLGYEMDPGPMIREFGCETHFNTFQLERTASFSANCNILITLLQHAHVERYQVDIVKAATWLHRKWDQNTIIKDKWNLSPRYSYMLLCQSFVSLLRQWDNGKLVDAPKKLLSDDIPILLSQVLSRTLAGQLEDGSWESSTEVTAYSIISINSALKLPWPGNLNSLAKIALCKARSYLLRRYDSWDHPEYLWVEKVSYGSPILAEAYCIAAMKSSTEAFEWSPRIREIFEVPAQHLARMAGFFSKLPLFQNSAADTICADLVEAHLYLKRLRAVRLSIFPRANMAEDKYLEYIPFTWVASNHHLNQGKEGVPLSGVIIWQMILTSMLNYQADEFMETTVSELSSHSQNFLKRRIQTECEARSKSQDSNGIDKVHVPQKIGVVTSPMSDSGLLVQAPKSDSTVAIQEVVCILKAYIEHMLSHPCVLNASPIEHDWISSELKRFILAHMKHNTDNQRLLDQKSKDVENRNGSATVGTYTSSYTSYYNWVWSTAADDTSCPYSFAFFCNLIKLHTTTGSHLFSSAREIYLAQALARHLAIMCRQYNDLGSLERDQLECNVNSLDFPEFLRLGGAREDSANRNEQTIDRAKVELLEMAEFERGCVEAAFERLSRTVGEEQSGAIRVFITVTDLYGQIYVARDIASRLKG